MPRYLIPLTLCALMWACDDGGGDSDNPTDPSVTPDAGSGPVGETICVGKCDFIGEPAVETGYLIDLDRANEIWPGAQPVTSADELFSVRIRLPGGNEVLAATHLFGAPINPIPYHDEDGTHVVDASGQVVMQGDRELARFFPPGSIGYAIKHHRPEHRVLDFTALQGASSNALKEDMKLQDTHIELVVGVRRPLGDSGELVDGVITLNNPQGYQNGRFGNETYGMVFVKPAFPDYLAEELHIPFEDNIRTMMLAFNAISKFPGDYNGGDPLGARTPDELREHVRQMVLAVAGEGQVQNDAKAYFQKPENMIYCAELAHVATSAGVLVPINQTGLVDSGLVGQDVYERFIQILDEHNAGIRTPLTELNANPYAAHVSAAVAPDDLLPMPEYAPDASELERLAFRPLTMVEIVEGFLKTHIPRNDERLGGEALAPLQAAVLQAMRPGLMEAMAMDDSTYISMLQRYEEQIAALNEDIADPDISEIGRGVLRQEIERLRGLETETKAHLEAVQTRRAQVDALFDQLVAVIGVSYESYDAFRAALRPVLEVARNAAGPRDGSGAGLFVPPSALHLVAQRSCDGDDRCGGLVGLNYVGHGIHMSALHLQQEPPPPPPVPIVRIQDVIPRPAGDDNGDGVADVRKDESVAVVNLGAAPVDLSGWAIHDNLKERFVFEGVTLDPGAIAIVWGGYEGTLPELNFAATLGLNDSGDSVKLYDPAGELVDTLTWGPVLPGEIIAHAAVCEEGLEEYEACGQAGERSRVCFNGEWTAWGDCVEPEVPGPDACQAPTTLELSAPSVSLQLDTTGLPNNHTATCGGSATGAEQVVEINVSERTHVIFEVSAQHDTVLHLRSACGDSGAEVACDDDGAGNLMSRLEVDLEPGVWFLFVDGFGTASGPVTLTATLDASTSSCTEGDYKLECTEGVLEIWWCQQGAWNFEGPCSDDAICPLASHDQCAACTDQFEDNDTMESAHQLEPGLYDGLSVCAEMDPIDYFRFEVQVPSYVTVKALSQVGLDVQILNESGERITDYGHSQINVFNDKVAYINAPGVYYAAISPYRETGDDYSFELSIETIEMCDLSEDPNCFACTDEFENNNTMDSAVEIERDRAYERLETCEDLDPTDWYSFEANEGEEIRVTLTQAEIYGHVSLFILDADGSLATHSGHGSGDRQWSDFTAAYTGRYFIEVRAEPGVARYSLIVE